MNSVLQPVRRRKKSRCLGAVKVVGRQAYEGMDLDATVELILELIPWPGLFQSG